MIKLSNVSKYYSSNDVIALGLRKVNLELHVNEFVAIVGESGSGKTTLLNVISGIDTYEEGEIYINGEETSYFSVSDMENYRKKYVAFVFQDYNLIDSYTVLQNVEAPLLLSGYPRDKIKTRAMEIIEKVGLKDHAHHKATKLSGGQKQRVVIARALAKDCPIIAADEPTGNLDSTSARQIIKLLADIAKDKLVIMVTHDFSQVAEFATRKIRIYDGEIVEDKELLKVEKKDLPKLEDKEFKINFTSMLRLSLRNLFAVPKKTLLMVLVFSFFAIFVGMAYGGYIIVSQQSAFFYNSHFDYTNPDRIVVKRADNQPLTESDLEQLSSYSQVKTLITHDYAMDMFRTLYSIGGDIDYISVNFLPLSLLPDDLTITYGDLPEEDNQVIIAASDWTYDVGEDAVGEILTDAFGFENTDFSFEVSGMVSNDFMLGSSLMDQDYIFVSDAMWEVIKHTQYFSKYGSVKIDFDQLEYSPYPNNLYIDPTLDDLEVRMSMNYSNYFCPDGCIVDAKLNINDYYVNDSYDIDLILDSNLMDNRFYVNQATYDLIFYDEIYQVSVMTNTDVNVEGLVRQIARLQDGLTFKYKVVYPFDSVPFEQYQGLLLIIANIGMVLVLLVTMIGSTFITYIIFKMIINTKLHDYAIFRTIGANQNVIKSFIYVENFYIVIIAFTIFLVLSLSLPNNIVEPFNAFKVFDVSSYIIYFILLVLMSLVVSRKYCNKIFSNSVSKTLKTDLE
ncbi:MAG: ATP-binding cassette domain-containing protein [Candidatus Izemoplasmatales bacterium]